MVAAEVAKDLPSPGVAAQAAERDCPGTAVMAVDLLVDMRTAAAVAVPLFAIFVGFGSCSPELAVVALRAAAVELRTDSTSSIQDRHSLLEVAPQPVVLVAWRPSAALP